MPKVISAPSPGTPAASQLSPPAGNECTVDARDRHSAIRVGRLPSPGEQGHASHPASHVQAQKKMALGVLC